MDAPHTPAESSAHATTCLVLGILSIMLSGCFPIGLVLGFIGIARSRAGFRELESSPRLEGQSLLVAGKVCSIIGTVMSVTVAAFWVLYILMLVVFALVTQSSRSGLS